MFIETKDDGWVNSDHVVKIEYRRPGWVLIGADGCSLGVVANDEDNPRTMAARFAARFVPAAPGAFAWMISYQEDEDKGGDLDTLDMEAVLRTRKVPIVAWCVAPRGWTGTVLDEPVFAVGDEPCSDDREFTIAPDGSLSDINGWYRDLAAAQKSVVKDGRDAVKSRLRHEAKRAAKVKA
jgi:hypothetical protein